MTGSSFWRRETLLSKTSRFLDVKCDYKLEAVRLKFENERQPVQGTRCIVYLVRQAFLASHGVTLVRVVQTTRRVLKGKCFT